MKKITFSKIFACSFVFFLSLGLKAQSLSNYAGNWKMTPMVPSHTFSKLTIIDNDNYLTINLKKSKIKNTIPTSSARINPSTNRVETFFNSKGYYLVLGAQPNAMSLFEIETNSKVGDYIK
ncbi:MAG: hypothetical protein ACKO7P_10005 [Bacteroidota bacterium]